MRRLTGVVTPTSLRGKPSISYERWHLIITPWSLSSDTEKEVGILIDFLMFSVVNCPGYFIVICDVLLVVCKKASLIMTRVWRVPSVYGNSSHFVLHVLGVEAMLLLPYGDLCHSQLYDLLILADLISTSESLQLEAQGRSS